MADRSEQDGVRGFGSLERLLRNRLAFFSDRRPTDLAILVGERNPEVFRRDVHYRPGGPDDLRPDAVAR
jgi:hypothetical protein